MDRIGRDEAIALHYLGMMSRSSDTHRKLYNSCKNLYSDNRQSDTLYSDERTHNILMPEIYDHLEYVIYNGPPQTEYGKFYKNLSVEKNLCEAVRVCTDDIYRYIKNPSDNVIMAYIDKHYGDESHFSRIENPSKAVISHLITKHYQGDVKKYEKYFTEKELCEWVTQKPYLIQKLTEPTINMYRSAIRVDPMMFRYVPKHLQTEEMCEEVILKLYGSDTLHRDFDFTQHIVHFNQSIVDLIIKTKQILDIDCIPINFLNRSNIIEALKINGMRLKNVLNVIKDNALDITIQDVCVIAFDSNIGCFEYIDKQFQTERMLNVIRNNKQHWKLVRFAKDFDDSFYEEMIKISAWNIEHVPFHKQTRAMCVDALQSSHHNLKYCAYFDRNMASMIFRSPRLQNTPRKTRFKFVNEFNQSTLIRLVSIFPSLIEHITNLTDDIIVTALQTDGYALQYVANQNEEYVKIALNNQPNAIKYVKIKMNDGGATQSDVSTVDHNAGSVGFEQELSD